MKKGLLALALFCLINCVSAQDIQLVSPTKTGGKRLFPKSCGDIIFPNFV